MDLIEPYASLVPYMVGIGNHEYDYRCKCSAAANNSNTKNGMRGSWRRRGPGNYWTKSSNNHYTDDDDDVETCVYKNDKSDPDTRGGYHPFLAYYLNDSGGECGVPYYHKFTMPHGNKNDERTMEEGEEAFGDVTQTMVSQMNNNNNEIINNDEDSVDGALPPFYYSFSYANAHFVVLSSEHSMERGSRQHTWLVNHLSGSNSNNIAFDRRRTPWLFFSLHRPLRSSMFIPPQWLSAYYMRSTLGELLEQYKVAAVFTGHVHTYERSCPLIGNTLRCAKNDMTAYSSSNSNDTNGNTDRGTVHLCVGTGGAHLHKIPRWPFFNGWVESFADQYGFGRVHVVNNTHLTWEFIANEDGRILDHVSIVNPYM